MPKFCIFTNNFEFSNKTKIFWQAKIWVGCSYLTSAAVPLTTPDCFLIGSG